MKKSMLAAALAIHFSLGAYAQESSPVRISGFGTGAITMTDTNDAQFARPNQASGAKRNPTTGVDSNLGLQADYTVNSWLSLTGQGLVRKDAEEGFGAELSWAFAKGRINDEVSVRVGRIGLPVFMISDYRNVGYANNFLRAPGELYSQVIFDSIDGADITWQRQFGQTNVTTQFAYGRTDGKLSGGLVIKARELSALNIVAEHGPFTFRVGRADTKMSLDNSTTMNNLLSGLRAAGAGYGFPQLATLANDLQLKDKKGSFTSAGMGLDWNNVVVQTEYAKRKTESYVNDTSSWYVMGGYRFGKVLPYYVHSELKIDGTVANSVPARCPTGYPPACAATMAALSAGVNRLPYVGIGQGEQKTDSIGVRWDFHPSMALKAQVDRVRPQVGTGLLLAPAPGFKDAVTVGAVAVDFVF